MNTIKTSLILLVYCTAITAQNNNNMEKLTQAVIKQDTVFLKENLTSENINVIYNFSVIHTMNVHLNDGTERSVFFHENEKGTLLHLTAWYNLPISTKILIEKGADVNAKDEKGRTPLEVAVNRYDVVTYPVQKVLIENKADMNFYVNKFFLDAPLLYFYIHWEQFELAELAIENGADVNMKTKDGESILKFAERRGTPKIVSMLQNNNHKLNEKWTANYKMEDTESQKTGAIEIEFHPDGTFRYDEQHPDESVSYANGTYYYREKTGEIFVHVESGGYDWIARQATETTPPLYWGEVYSNYQLYFKITKRSYSTVTVIEHINSNHEGVSNTAIWKENNGSYSLIAIDQNMMKEKQYTVSFSI